MTKPRCWAGFRPLPSAVSCPRRGCRQKLRRCAACRASVWTLGVKSHLEGLTPIARFCEVCFSNAPQGVLRVV